MRRIQTLMERCGDCEKACDVLGEGAEGGFADDTESSESDSSESEAVNQ